MRTAEVEFVEWNRSQLAIASANLLHGIGESSANYGIDISAGLEIFVPQVIDTIESQRFKRHALIAERGIGIQFLSFPRKEFGWDPRFNFFAHGNNSNIDQTALDALSDIGEPHGLNVSSEDGIVIVDFSKRVYAKRIHVAEIPLILPRNS